MNPMLIGAVLAGFLAGLLCHLLLPTGLRHRRAPLRDWRPPERRGDP
jgi:hypothetical protein